MILLFLMIQCKSAFKGILGWSLLDKLDVVSSTIHLKITYHDKRGVTTTIKAYLEEENRIRRRIHEDILTSASKNCDKFNLDVHEGKIRPTPDGEFEFMQLGDNLARSIKIRYKLSP